MQAIGELWKLLWCCRSNFTFLFLSFSPPFLFPSPLQVLSLDKSVSLLPTLSILPTCLFPVLWGRVTPGSKLCLSLLGPWSVLGPGVSPRVVHSLLPETWLGWVRATGLYRHPAQGQAGG